MPVEVKLPVLGENVESATVVRLLIKPGDKITQDQPIMELETEKASVDLPSPAAGTAQNIQVKEGDTVKVGQVLLTLDEDGQRPKRAEPAAVDEKPAKAESPVQAEPEQPTAPPLVATPPEPDAQPLADVAPAAPSLHRMARELGIDIHAVTGTGADGRITEEDIRNYARSIILNATVPDTTATTTLPDFSRWGDIERKPMSAIRRKTAEHVLEAWTTIPHVTQFGSADITELEKARQLFAKRAEEAGAKVNITVILIKVVALALKVFPQLNVSIDTGTGEIISKKYCNIGIAVDTEHGLLVPVIRDADKKNLLETSVAVAQIVTKARDRKIAVDEMQGGTFTISNLGNIGGSFFTPIVNSPEVAILGVSRAAHQAMFVDGEFQPRLMLPLSLSYDHRAVDGADGARFLRWIVEALEQPFKVLFES